MIEYIPSFFSREFILVVPPAPSCGQCFSGNVLQSRQTSPYSETNPELLNNKTTRNTTFFCLRKHLRMIPYNEITPSSNGKITSRFAKEKKAVIKFDSQQDNRLSCLPLKQNLFGRTDNHLIECRDLFVHRDARKINPQNNLISL